MKNINRCPNMNHGRSNPPIRFCPACGEIVNRAISAGCNEGRHASQRKSGSHFCMDCGRDLTSSGPATLNKR